MAKIWHSGIRCDAAFVSTAMVKDMQAESIKNGRTFES